MKTLCTLLLISALSFSCLAQEKRGFFKKQLFTEYDHNYHYLQGTTLFSNTNNLYGLQYKRQKVVSAGGVFTFATGSTLGINYTQLNKKDLLNSNVEVHLSSYPYTALIRLGAGIDYTTDFNTTNYLSVYPSVGFDIGIVEVSYNYLINEYNSSKFSDHRIKIALGPWIKKT